MLDAMNVLAGVDGDAFGCHHGMEQGEPSRPCVGWIAARRASFGELQATLLGVLIPDDDDPKNDPVGVYVTAWVKRNDPEGKLDNYQLARLWEKTGPHEIPLDV